MSSAPEIPPPAGRQLAGRLHPAAMLTWALQQAFGLVVLLVFGGVGGAGMFFVAAAGLAVLAGLVVRWYRFRWSVQGDSLVIEQGLVNRSRRVIPRERIQSVDLVRPIGHQVLGVVRAKVETIGGSSSEGVLEALDPQTATSLRQALLERETDQPAHQEGQASSQTVLAQVEPASLVIAGLTGGRVGVIALILGAVQQVAGDRIDEAIEAVPTDLGVVTIAVVVAVGAVVVFGLSVLATVLTYWDFTLARDGADLHVSRGLLEQRRETIPLHRIQSLRVEQNLLRRRVGLASVKADLAGRAGGGDTGTGMLLPVAPEEEALGLIARLLDADAPTTVALQPAPERSRRRYLVRGLLGGLLGLASGTAGWAFGGEWWLLVVGALIGLCITIPWALAAWRTLGWSVIDDVLVARSGVMVRRRVHVPVGRIQRMSLHTNPFQRRLGLTRVSVGIARSGGWEGPTVHEIDHEEGRDLVAATLETAVSLGRAAGPRPATHQGRSQDPRGWS